MNKQLLFDDEVDYLRYLQLINDIKNINDDYCLKEAHPLQAGDILVRSGHVEIYLNPELSFGWGQVHNSYENNPHSKSFKWHFGNEDEVEGSNKPEEYYFYNSNISSEGNYTIIYRYEGEQK